MSNWINKIDLKDLWNNKLTFENLTKMLESIKTQLEKIKLEGNSHIRKTIVEHRLDLYDDIEVLMVNIEEESFSLEEVTGKFNYIMNNLYDLGNISLDTKFGGTKLCWIKTRF